MRRSEKPRSALFEASKGDETGRRNPISLLKAGSKEASDAPLEPFRTVSTGYLVNRGSGGLEEA